MLNKLKKVGYGERIGRPRRQGHIKVVFLMVVLTFKTSLGSTRSFLIKFPPNLPKLVMILCVTLSLKREVVVAHQARSQLVESVARKIMGIVFLGWTIALGVEKVATRLGIYLISRVNTKEVGKLKLVVLMLLLQGRIAFMHFAKGVNKRVLLMW